MDLIGLARDAADALRDRDPGDTLARALDGVAAEVAADAHEPARLVNVDAPVTPTASLA